MEWTWLPTTKTVFVKPFEASWLSVRGQPIVVEARPGLAMRLALDWTAEMQEWLERALKTYYVTTTASIQASKDLERLITRSPFARSACEGRSSNSSAINRRRSAMRDETSDGALSWREEFADRRRPRPQDDHPRGAFGARAAQGLPCSHCTHGKVSRYLPNESQPFMCDS